MKTIEVYNWINAKGISIEQNDFFDACIHEAIDLVHNTTINGSKFADTHSVEEILQEIVRNFVTIAKVLLTKPAESVSVQYHNLSLRAYYSRCNELLSQLSQLAALYSE